MVSSHPDPCLVLVSSCSISTTSGSGNSLIVHWPIANTPECCQRAFSTQWFAFACTCGFSPEGRGCGRGVAEWGEAGHWGGKAVRVGIRLSFCLSRLNEIDLLWVSPILLCFPQNASEDSWALSPQFAFLSFAWTHWSLEATYGCVCTYACMRVCVWACAFVIWQAK